MTTKDVIDPKKELAQGPSPAPVAPPPKVYQFKKIRFPKEKITLPGVSRPIQFEQRKLNTGGQSVWGVFETTDEKIASALREFAGPKGGNRYIYEVITSTLRSPKKR